MAKNGQHAYALTGWPRMAFDQRKRLHAHLALGLAGVFFLATRAVRAETLFYASFDKTLKADVASGDPSPVGADTAVISVFTEITGGGKGVAKPGAADRGEDLDLASKRGVRATLSYESEGNINTSQGTIQCWVYPMFDLWPMRGKDAWRSFLDVRTNGTTVRLEVSGFAARYVSVRRCEEK
ncbi:MAG: hypothetical protein FJ279_26715 [Planctomycetes bacterium]|nr:hypothetical protein [Planctomycetota bacterium]MBM4087762.1 hypothetical protein [Planctomycetota bacterium]